MTPRVVITHDFMEVFGGAERVTAEIALAYPGAPVVALLGRRDVAERMGVAERFHSVVAPKPGVLRHYRLGAPAWGMIAARAALPEADVVISSSYAYAHRMSPPGGARSVCYCHSPLRFAWSMTEAYRHRWASDGARARAFDLFAAQMRRSDRRAARAIDRYLTQSPFTAAQIKRFYGIDAQIVGAPIDGSTFTPGGRDGDHYLIVSRLVEPYKRVSVAVEAFRKMPDLKLVIVGDGPAYAELAADLPSNVTMTGALGDCELIELMRSCRAAVFPSVDDFGLVPVEVMACGRPVLAFAGGGALHTVRPGLSGEFFDAQTPEAINRAVRTFDPDAYDRDEIRRHAMQWDSARFRERLVASVNGALGDDLRAEPSLTGTFATAGTDLRRLSP